MQTELVYTTSSCAGNDCAAVRRVISPEGGYVIVGKQLSPADRATIPNVGDGEGVLWVPADVIERSL